MSLTSPNLASQLSVAINWSPELDLHDFQTYELDSPLRVAQDEELPALLDFDALFPDLSAEIVQQDVEEPCLKSRSMIDETGIRLINTSQSITSITPLVDHQDLVAHLPLDNSEKTVKKASADINRVDSNELTPDDDSLQEIEIQLQFVQNELQRGLFPKDGQVHVDQMKAMSIYLKNLERMSNPSPSILRSTKITELLREVTILDEIPRDAELLFTTRASKLLEKWTACLEEENMTMSSPPSTIYDDLALEVATDKPKLTCAVVEEEIIENMKHVSASDATEDNGVKEVISPEKSTAVPGIVSVVIPVDTNSQPTPPLSPATQTPSKARIERLYIDLTSDTEFDMVTRLDLPPQSANHQRLGSNVAKSTEALTTSSINSHPVRKVRAVTGFDLALAPVKKRKRFNKDEGPKSTSKKSSGKHGSEGDLYRQRPQRKTSPREHLANEILWMSESALKIDMMIKDAEQELDAIQGMRQKIITRAEQDIDMIKRRTKCLLEDNESRLLSASKRKKLSTEFKDDLLAWGAVDEKVTEEWSH